MNAARMIFDNLARYGEYDKVYYEGKTLTNAETLRSACCLAAVLREYRVGVNDHVAVMMSNSPDVEAAIQAAWILGAVIIPITPQFGPREAGFMLRDGEVTVVLTSPTLAARVEQACENAPKVRQVLVFGSPDFESAIAAATPLDAMVERSDNDLALLLYTSGTTGNPKGVMLTHANILAGPETFSRLNPDAPRHILLHPLPLSHVYGVLIMNLCNAWGWTTILMPHFETKRALELIEKHKVTRLSVVPTMLVYLIHSPDREKFDMSSLVSVGSGGAALPEPVRLEFEKLFQCTVRQGYGLSESAAVATSYAEDEEYRPLSVGRALPGLEIVIKNSEICVRGPNIMAGYWNNPEATASTVVDGWLHTGDVGHIDADGYVYITDRKKDLIIKGGENISPREIEEAIQSHPAVAEVSVIGVSDDTFGENICAAVVLRAGSEATADEIRTYAAQSIAKFKLPSRIEFMETLPKSPVGKVLKREIRKLVGGV